MPAETCLSAKGREEARRAHKRRTARAPTRGAPTGAYGGRRPQGGTCGGWKLRRVRGHPQGAPLRARAAGGGHKGCLRWMEVEARTRAPTRGAPTGACGGRRPQRGTCDGGRLQRVRGHPQGVHLQARAAGGGRKGAPAMEGGCSAYEGTHKGCTYRRVRREAAARGHLRWREVAARTRAPTRGATGACGGRRPQRGALAMEGGCSAYEGTHKGCTYGALTGRAGRGLAKLFRLGICRQCRHQVDEACCRRGGVAGAEPPHKGGPNRPDRPTAVVSGQWLVVGVYNWF